MSELPPKSLAALVAAAGVATAVPDWDAIIELDPSEHHWSKNRSVKSETAAADRPRGWRLIGAGLRSSVEGLTT